MSRIVASTWGALPDYSIIVDERTGELVQLYRRLLDYSPSDFDPNFVWFASTPRPRGAPASAPVALVEPDEPDAIVNMMRSGFVVQVLGAINADDALADNGELVTFISTRTRTEQ